MGFDYSKYHEFRCMHAVNPANRTVTTHQLWMARRRAAGEALPPVHRDLQADAALFFARMAENLPAPPPESGARWLIGFTCDNRAFARIEIGAA